MSTIGDIVATAFNATWLVEFGETGFEMYEYDDNAGDYISSSIHHTGHMEWNLLHSLEDRGFSILVA